MTTDTSRSNGRRRRRAEGLPRWTLIFGACCLGLGILFLMLLVVFATRGFLVPCGQRFLVGSLVGMLLAAGTGVLGTQATLQSNAPLLGDHPVAISLTGGVAVFLVVLFAFGRVVPDCAGKPTVALVSADADRTGAEAILLRIAFKAEGVILGQRLYLEAGDEEPRRLWLLPAQLDDPQAGRALLAVANRTADRGCAQLRLADVDGSEVARSKLLCFDVPPAS